MVGRFAGSSLTSPLLEPVSSRALTIKAVRDRGDSYVATGKVTTLEHEVRDDAVEAGAGVAKAVLASAELPEIPGSLGDDLVEEVEGDAALLLDCYITRVSGWPKTSGGAFGCLMPSTPASSFEGRQRKVLLGG